MDAAVRAFVRTRAAGLCEYGRLRQTDQPYYRFQVEHVIARQHGGGDAADNLALACPFCNQHKGSNLPGLDPLDGTLIRLFHPRTDGWDDHFAARGPLIVGRTAVGRTTVRVLNRNDPGRVRLRATLLGLP